MLIRPWNVNSSGHPPSSLGFKLDPLGLRFGLTEPEDRTVPVMARRSPTPRWAEQGSFRRRMTYRTRHLILTQTLHVCCRSDPDFNHLNVGKYAIYQDPPVGVSWLDYSSLPRMASRQGTPTGGSRYGVSGLGFRDSAAPKERRRDGRISHRTLSD